MTKIDNGLKWEIKYVIPYFKVPFLEEQRDLAYIFHFR